MIDLTFERLIASIIAGLVSGLYWTLYHPPGTGTPLRRALTVAWFFAFPLSVLYLVRIGISAFQASSDPTFVDDGPRLWAGWILTLVFCAAIGVGAYVGTHLRIWRSGD